MVVDRSDPSSVENMAAKNTHERYTVFYNKDLRQMAPRLYFKTAVEDGTNTIFRVLGDNLVQSQETLDSITRVLQNDSDHDRAAKHRQ